MVPRTLRFLEVSIESWFEWDLKSRTLNSTQTFYAIRPHSVPTLNSCSNIIFYSVFTFHFDHCHHHLGNLAKSRKRESKINLLSDAHNCHFNILEKFQWWIWACVGPTLTASYELLAQSVLKALEKVHLSLLKLFISHSCVQSIQLSKKLHDSASIFLSIMKHLCQ